MNRIASAVVALALLTGSVSFARADQPGPDWLPIQQVIEKVLRSGYTLVSKIEADDERAEDEVSRRRKDGRPGI